jgi:hypothetical protein
MFLFVSWSRAIMTKRSTANHWFVSVEALRRGRLAPRAPARETKTFSTEAEAKQYAKEMLSEQSQDHRGQIAERVFVVSSRLQN